MKSLEHEQRLFDLEHANRTLPLVSRIVEDIVRVNGEIWELHGRARELAEAGRREAAEDLMDRLQDLVRERGAFVDELEKIGCELKDPDVGLVDFPSRLGDRIVYLCWKRGEKEIAYWHEVYAGYPGRRSVRGVRFSR